MRALRRANLVLQRKTVGETENLHLWEENRAFFQANLIKGGRYLDVAGAIINDYRDAYDKFTVGLNELQFVKPKNNNMPDSIAVNIDRIWIANYGPGSIKKVKETAEAITRDISRHLGVDSYSRLGFRVHYFKRVKDVRSYSRRVYSATASSQLQTVHMDRQLGVI